MSVDTLTLAAADEDAMVRLGAALAMASEPGLVIFLHGELGAGKTTLTRGFIQALGHRGAVKSPTYTLVEPYDLAGRVVYHFDLYRLGDPEELEFMGIHDYFDDDATCLVEWPERGLGVLPPADLVINISVDGLGRSLELRSGSAAGMAVTAQLRQQQPSED
jgi:tRNA threonylcarbamoyladenosine biosynthesis protein TsaE